MLKEGVERCRDIRGAHFAERGPFHSAVRPDNLEPIRIVHGREPAEVPSRPRRRKHVTDSRDAHLIQQVEADDVVPHGGRLLVPVEREAAVAQGGRAELSEQGRDDALDVRGAEAGDGAGRERGEVGHRGAALRETHEVVEGAIAAGTLRGGGGERSESVALVGRLLARAAL